MKPLHVQAELVSERFDENFDIWIVGGSDLSFATTAPMSFGKPVTFQPQEPMQIHYYFGELMYVVDVLFLSVSENEQPLYVFEIETIQLETNKRLAKRRNIHCQGAFWDGTTFHPCSLLDSSDCGVKLKSDIDITVPVIDLYYGVDGQPRILTMEIVWKREEFGLYFYGLRTLSEK